MTAYEWIGISEADQNDEKKRVNQIKKIKKQNQRQNTTFEQKTTSQKWNLDQTNKKLGPEWTMNGLEKPFRKCNPKNGKQWKSKWNCHIWTKN